ncbi:SDR family oxidoreductase [uncultured Succiniclasticum sp.]|uniref:SDR family NAD(P)-dependent oxidoreductase n=1 Tax=uncultured Succiniclasticum sp. TaxID=1500547 RepID=UPI0025DBCF8B|nr:SDR family oxidoreductase [uncultured Succiniclasticum sp.]
MKQYKSNDNQIVLNVNIGLMMTGKLLEGRTVLITGASGGIGACIAKQCVEQNANVILIGRNQKRLEDLCKEIGNKASQICVDLQKVSDFDALIQEAYSYYGNIDCLVNNAGVSFHEGDFMNVTKASWDTQFDINLKVPFFLTQSWLRYYRVNNLKNGRVVLMASDTSGMGSTIPYGLTKAGIASFTYGLAKKLIVEGIRVNALAPGTTLTPMTQDFTHGELCRASTQGKRTLFPEEIAQLCIFLLSDLSACVSGNIFGCSEANICFNNIEREMETNP